MRDRQLHDIEGRPIAKSHASSSGPSSHAVVVGCGAQLRRWNNSRPRCSKPSRASCPERGPPSPPSRSSREQIGTPVSPQCRQPTPGCPATRRRSTVARSALYLGARRRSWRPEWSTSSSTPPQDYSTVPTIGTLFLLNFVSAAVIALGLVAPYRRIAGRHADAIRAACALSRGSGLPSSRSSACSCRSRPRLFNFDENGYRTPIVLAIVAEAAATALLLVFLAANGTGLAKIRGLSTRPALNQ